MNHLRNALLVVLMSCVFQNTHAVKPSLKLPYADGTSWMLVQAYNANLHVGTDYYALDFTQSGCDAWDEPILAIAGGTVEVQTYAPDGYGNNILINHGDGYKSRYAHLNSISVTNGQTVIQGEEIGRCGNSGNVSGQSCESHPGTHLHLVLYHNGQAEIMEPMSGYTGFTAGQWYTSDNSGITYSCSYVSQNPSGQYDMIRGQTAQFEVKFKNEGNTTWQNNATSYPNDYVELKSCGIDGTVMGSFLYDASWLNTESPCSMVEASVAPGGTATFQFTGKVSETAPIELKDVYFRPNQSVGGLMQDWGGMKFQINVVETNPGSGNKADIATFYDYGGTSSRLHMYLSNGSSFDYQGKYGWWMSTGYNSSSVLATVSADVDGDGDDDVIHMYNYSASRRLHVFKSTGSSFAWTGSTGWWLSPSSYDASKVVGMVAGHFNNDSYEDVAVLYAESSNRLILQVFYSTGSSFVKQTWWDSNGIMSYYSSNINGFTVGDYNNDGKDDISIVYHMGYRSTGEGYLTRLHVFKSTGSSFTMDGSSGWWSSPDNYEAARVHGAVSGDFDNDGKDDLALVYYMGFRSGGAGHLTRLHFFKSTGSAFNYYQIWWNPPENYEADKVVHVASGDFTGDGTPDVCMMYDSTGVRLHILRSAGTSFVMSGGYTGWWMNTGYNPSREDAMVAGHFNTGASAKVADSGEDVLPTTFSLSQNYPNPFNPVTTINYTLPSAIHVRLDVFNILGQNVQTLVDQHQTAGEHTVLWDSKKFSSGVYLYRIQAGEVIETKKMMLLK